MAEDTAHLNLICQENRPDPIPLAAFSGRGFLRSAGGDCLVISPMAVNAARADYIPIHRLMLSDPSI